jgi:hypothetical protein
MLGIYECIGDVKISESTLFTTLELYIRFLANATSLRLCSKNSFHTTWYWTIQMTYITHATTQMPIKLSKTFGKIDGKNKQHHHEYR